MSEFSRYFSSEMNVMEKSLSIVCRYVAAIFFFSCKCVEQGKCMLHRKPTWEKCLKLFNNWLLTSNQKVNIPLEKSTNEEGKRNVCKLRSGSLQSLLHTLVLGAFFKRLLASYIILSSSSSFLRLKNLFVIFSRAVRYASLLALVLACAVIFNVHKLCTFISFCDEYFTQ